MPTLKVIVIYLLLLGAHTQVTKIQQRNALLSRKKRFLSFPAKSNFVISYSAIKALLRTQPTGWNMLGEMDVPFALPSGAQWLKDAQHPASRRHHHVQRRDMLGGFEAAFAQEGLNGTACVRRMICDARQFIDSQGSSLVKDILLAIFTSTEIDLEGRYGNSCQADTFAECDVPFLSYILGSLLNALE